MRAEMKKTRQSSEAAAARTHYDIQLGLGSSHRCFLVVEGDECAAG